MDFIVGLPMMASKFDSIWVIVDRLSKSTHFIPVRTRYNVRRYASQAGQSLYSAIAEYQRALADFEVAAGR